MEIGEKMACKCKVKGMRVLFISVLAFLIMSTVHAEPPNRPEILDSEWNTGEITIYYDNVVPGATIELYTRKWNTEPYTLRESFIAEGSSGQHLSRYYENGQSVWFYIRQCVDGECSERSGIYHVTPPITAFIINWPDIFKDIQSMFQNLEDHLDGLFTPSQEAIDDLQDAVDNLKNSVGVGSAENAGNDLINGLDDLADGLPPPLIEDDGEHTYDGGPGGYPATYEPTETDGDMKLEYPSTMGRHNDLTFRIPLHPDMNGDLVYYEFFTDEQLEKMMWMDVIRKIAVAAIWIIFGIWVVSRFSPIFKT